eukprot:1452337-Alexandrium_andersonii.AAC.1
MGSPDPHAAKSPPPPSKARSKQSGIEFPDPSQSCGAKPCPPPPARPSSSAISMAGRRGGNGGKADRCVPDGSPDAHSAAYRSACRPGRQARRLGFGGAGSATFPNLA